MACPSFEKPAFGWLASFETPTFGRLLRMRLLAIGRVAKLDTFTTSVVRQVGQDRFHEGVAAPSGLFFLAEFPEFPVPAKNSLIRRKNSLFPAKNSLFFRSQGIWLQSIEIAKQFPVLRITGNLPATH
jgi:hypothetical protein